MPKAHLPRPPLSDASARVIHVFVANEQEVPVDEDRASAIARHALTEEDIEDSAELSVLFVTSDHIHHLNARFADEDHATNVLAFPMMEDDDGSLVLGDVVVCPQVAGTYAERKGQSLDDEIDHLVVHGILHLLGYDHQNDDDSARMRKRTDEILVSFREQPA